MLFYFADGMRDYGESPSKAGQSRRNWEFQAVLSGRIGRTFDSTGSGELHADSLWLSPPDSLHGWFGQPGEPAEVAVFHFRYIPQALSHLLKDSQGLRIDLDEAKKQRIHSMVGQTKRFWNRPSQGMMLSFDNVLSELSFLVFDSCSSVIRDAGGSARRLVDRALLLFEERLAENLSIDFIARSVGTSTAHLRRCFHEILDLSPKSVFNQIRDRRVVQMLTNSECSLAGIAEATGFSEPSALSRAFKKRHGFPPSNLRIHGG